MSGLALYTGTAECGQRMYEIVYSCVPCKDTGFRTSTDPDGFFVAARCPCGHFEKQVAKETASGFIRPTEEPKGRQKAKAVREWQD